MAARAASIASPGLVPQGSIERPRLIVPSLQTGVVMSLILRLHSPSSHLFSLIRDHFRGERTTSYLWMVSGPKGHPHAPSTSPVPSNILSAPHPGRRPDSQPNFFSTGPGVKDREAAGEAGGRRPSLTPGFVEKTLE